MLGVCFGHQHLGTRSSCRRRTGSFSPHQEVKLPLAARPWGSVRHTSTTRLLKVGQHPPPHIHPVARPGGGSAPGAPAGGEWAGGTASRSQSCREQPPRHGTDLVPALLSTDELSAAWRVFRNQNRMFPGCQPAAQGYQA